MAFVGRMIEESLTLKDSVQWYTSMVGKLSSVPTLVEKLQKAGNHNWAISEFVQGNKTRRWAIGWSWKDIRPTAVRTPAFFLLKKVYISNIFYYRMLHGATSRVFPNTSSRSHQNRRYMYRQNQ